MTSTSLIVLFIIYGLSIILLIISALITIGMVIPLQRKEAMVKNGLAVLRKQILAKGVLSVLLSVAAILSLTARFFVSGDLARYITIALVAVFSISKVIDSIIDHRIYHTSYSEESKEHHVRIAKMEAAEAKKK